MDLDTRYRLLHGTDTEAARAELARVKATGKPVVVVSACLLGVRCRHDGGDRQDDDAVARVVAGRDVALLPLCPEVLARMGVPRPAIHLSADGKRATDDAGADVTSELAAGARLADRFASEVGAAEALLKDRSPSCGVHEVYLGRKLGPGQGRFAARLIARGVAVSAEKPAPPPVEPAAAPADAGEPSPGGDGPA